MSITALPTPPSRSDPTNFASRADGFLGALPTFATEANALQADVNSKQSTASTAATTATTKAGEAAASAAAALTSETNSGISATAAAASAASAAAVAGSFVGTSTSSLLIGTGNKTFITQTGEQYTAGIWMTAVSAANGSNYMFGQVVSYSGSSLVIDVQATGGSGTYADWNLSLAGPRGAAGTGVTPQAVGFTLSGGTTAKTMTVDTDVTTSNLAAKNAAQTFTATQTFNGSSSTFGTVLLDSAETVNVVAAAPSATTNLYVQSGSVQYYTTNAANNFVVNIAFSSGTSMNTALAVGQVETATLITTQGATAYYGTSIQVDGTTTGVTTKWIGGAPTAGNASGLDTYRFALIKTASATYTVLASLTQYK